jgi:AAA15 family ATPase/GTPase
MVKNVSIKNFKSLKDVSFESRRVNIFIGEPNTGKSNLLEALGTFSLNRDNYERILRYRTFYDLFFDNDTSESASITADSYTLTIAFHNEECKFWVKDNNSSSFGEFGRKVIPKDSLLLNLGVRNNWGVDRDIPLPFHYYKFAVPQKFRSDNSSFLSVPDGDNLFSILRSNKELREIAEAILRDKGYRLHLRTGESEIELVKDEGVLISYPYQSISDTLQRIIFYLAAIKSNKDAILLLEEPEAHTFPFYTKFLAERIALEESNQYFIVTHNPYFLLSLVEKTPLQDIAIFITYMEDYQTKLRPLADSEIGEILDLNTDIFFNLDKFLNHEAFPRM